MTHDAEKHDEPDKIDIRSDILESSPDNRFNVEHGYHVKRFFEKGLNALLEDPNFLLLYVPEDGAKMRIVRPEKDPYHRRRMIKRVNEAKPIPSFYYALSHLWGITENNQHLWHEIGDYVDDENGKPVDPVSMREEKRVTLLKMLEDSPDSYWWIDVLCARSDTPLDIMGDIYACCLECIAMVDCEPSLIPLLQTMMPAEEDLPSDTRSIWEVYPILYMSYKQIYDKKYPHLLEHLFTFIQSEWWQRVWTWQEMAHPFGDMRLMGEEGTHRHTISLNYLSRSCSFMIVIMKEYVVWGGHLESSAALRNVEAVYYWLYTVLHARTFTKTRIEKMSAGRLMALMGTLGNSTRRCMNPVDYVYGVLGMLQIKIPRTKDPNEVWQSFLCEFESLINGDMTDEESEVNHMGDVYEDFLTFVLEPGTLYKPLNPPSMASLINQQKPNMPNEQQQQLNTGMRNNISNPNWRDELSESDRNRLITRLAQALKLLSPNTSENDIYTAARDFEHTLYNNSINKNQYILSYAKNFHELGDILKNSMKNQDGDDGILFLQ
ncbi:hypothetical protein K492DRAFT_194627 [Lichtheimia hyalospora FSU 10163]|nr:hypothetical protein K492DRAFT_194627 [Lichtheimia hyalospora FSU 10163]